MPPSLITVQNLNQTYPLPGSPAQTLDVLRDVTFSIQPGEWIALTGPSGSGKSTLLSLLSGLDHPTSGSVRYADRNLAALGDDALSRFRAQEMGFVFQAFHLVPALSALQNVMLPLEILGTPYRQARERAQDLLARVGLSARMDHDPQRLSGGEQQRVALARALVHRPAYLFADEPTGNLDSTTGHSVMELISELRAGATLVMVTHDAALANQADRQIALKDGKMAGHPAC